ncbi:MAG: hypothetical protein ACQEQS_01365 [Thermodesulfobacteriota bacterium]
MGKNIWITMVDEDNDQAGLIYSKLSEYGLNVQGSIFQDNIEKMEWALGLDKIKKSDLWIICGSKKTISKESVMFGLSASAIAVKAAKGDNFPVMIVSEDEITDNELPLPLKNAVVISAANSSFQAKAAAKANLPVKKTTKEYRINLIPIIGSGLWAEAGPSENSWNGILTGVSDSGSVDALGIGEKSVIPEKSVLEYPVRDMKIELNNKEFTAWGANNIITKEESAFFRIKGAPSSLIFGSFNDDNNPMVYIIDLYKK